MKQRPHHVMLFFVLWLCPILSQASVQPGTANTSHFLVISDLHLDQSMGLTMTINPSKPNPFNDLDSGTFKTMLTEINHAIKNGVVTKPQFILILGDISGHLRLWPRSVEKNESAVFSLLRAQFPQTPIFYVFGNNDALSANYGSFNDPTYDGHDHSPYEIAQSQGGWFDGFLSTGTPCQSKQSTYPCLITENTNQGYYSASLNPKLRLIALNSIQFSTKRAETTDNDAMMQLQWLATQLESAQKQHASVVIAMHIPPGNNSYDDTSFWQTKEQAAFLKLITQHQHTIIGLLASHTHAEELKIIKTPGHHIIQGLYLTAALSTSHGNAPSIKLFNLTEHHHSWQLSNYETFYFSLKDSKLKLNPLYDASYYCNAHQTNLSTCLRQVTAEKMKHYLSAGNPNFKGVMGSPGDINIIIDNDLAYR